MLNNICKIISFKKDIESEKGQIKFIGFFLRKESIGNWDVIVCADWINADIKDTLNFLTPRLKIKFKDEVLTVGRIVPMEISEPFEIDTFPSAVQIIDGHNVKEIRDCFVNNIEIERGYIITNN